MFNHSPTRPDIDGLYRIALNSTIYNFQSFIRAVTFTCGNGFTPRLRQWCGYENVHYLLASFDFQPLVCKKERV